MFGETAYYRQDAGYQLSDDKAKEAQTRLRKGEVKK